MTKNNKKWYNLLYLTVPFNGIILTRTLQLFYCYMFDLNTSYNDFNVFLSAVLTILLAYFMFEFINYKIND